MKAPAVLSDPRNLLSITNELETKRSTRWRSGAFYTQICVFNNNRQRSY